MALQLKTSPRTLQRFLESIKWDEERLRDRCQQIVAKDHDHEEAIGCIDESGTTTTSSGLRVVCEKATKPYAPGVKASPAFRAQEPTIRDENLSAYNYKFSPN